MDRLGYSDNICNWLRSYLTHRTAQFRIDGILCPTFQLPDVGIPQGSPLSPVLSSIYSIPLLVSSIDPQAHSFAYIDDFTILAYSNSHNNNINNIKDIVININNTAKLLGLEFEIPKSELIHFIRHCHSSTCNPKLTIPIDDVDTVIEPLECIRWLGFYLDRRLSFKEHVRYMSIKAKATISGLRMLANVYRGLSTHHARMLYTACVTPILTYGSPLWFHGRRQKSLTGLLGIVQNQGIRWLLGAFKTTPIPVLEHLGSIPPIHITCRKINDNLASKLKATPRLAERNRRLPASWDTSDPTLPSIRRARAHLSPIHHIATLSHPDAERIFTHTIHPSSPENTWGERLAIHSKADGTKRTEFAKNIKYMITDINSSPDHVTCYSDGHMSQTGDTHRVGVGYVIQMGGHTRATFARGIGPRANIYDAEMLGIALGLTRAIRYASTNNASHVVVFADSQSAISQINSLKPHPAQYASLIFRRAVNLFLDNQPSRSITLQWAPGHCGISGNELADKLATAGGLMTPATTIERTVTWIRHNASMHAVKTWQAEWDKHVASRPESGYFIPRPPSLKLHSAFKDVDSTRADTARLVQLISGHGFYGEYHDKMKHEINPQCSCGESIEGIRHRLFHCRDTEAHRHILKGCSPSLNERELFGSVKGLTTVSKFIKDSGIGRLRGQNSIDTDT